ncbi:hypothetical protein WEH80_11050 [Actinomycetes bacterium KLBMP 9759]
MTPIAITPGPDGSFRSTAMVETGRSSLVVRRAWVTFGSTWGGSQVLISALDDAGRVMHQGVLDAHVQNNRRVVLELPSGAVMVTVEGRCDPGAVPAAGLSELLRDDD